MLELINKTLSPDEIKQQFATSDQTSAELSTFLADPSTVVGQTLTHVWSVGDQGEESLYNGKVLKWKKRENKLKISYWATSESFEESVDYDIPIKQLAADMLLGDLHITSF